MLSKRYLLSCEFPRALALPPRVRLGGRPSWRPQPGHWQVRHSEQGPARSPRRLDRPGGRRDE